MTESRLYELIADYCAGKLSEVDSRELLKLLESDPEIEKIFIQIRAADKYLKTNVTHETLAGNWKSFESRLNKQIRGKIRSRLLFVSATAAVLIAAILVYTGLNRNVILKDNISGIAGGVTKVILRTPGGHQVYLDSGISEDQIAAYLNMEEITEYLPLGPGVPNFIRRLS